MCAYDDGYSHICVDHQTDIIFGFEWIQNFSASNSINYYQLQFRPYFEVELIIHPEIDLDTIWYFEFTADVDQFKAALFMEFVFHWNYWVCFNLGAFVEDILMKFEFAQKFQDCYKTLVKSITEWETAYGASSTWPFDECD